MTATQTTTPTSAGTTVATAGPAWLGVLAAIGGIGSTVLYLVLEALRPGYNPILQQISVLGTGSNGFWMDLGFVLSGLLVVAGMIGLGLALPPGLDQERRLAVTILLAFPALGLIVCGLFHMDTNLLVHTIGAQIACGLPIFTFAISAALIWRSSRRVAVWLIISAALILLALLGYIFLSPTAPHDFQTVEGGGTVGLWERILTTVVYDICYSSLGLIGVVLARRRRVETFRPTAMRV